jgi:S-adenosylmethionine hydrolase
VGDRRVPLVGTYGDLEQRAPGALIGSANRLEIAVREGSAQAHLNAARGTPVVLARHCA